MELLTDSREEMSERDFQYYVAVEKTHRLNVGFEGTWFLLTLIALIQVSKDR
jgi:hypothetical protein